MLKFIIDGLDLVDHRLAQMETGIAEAREAAAGGRIKYQDALETFAKREGFTDWATLTAIAKNGYSSIEHRETGGADYIRDKTASGALYYGTARTEFRRDRWLAAALGAVMDALKRMGVPYRFSETSIVWTAWATTLSMPILYANAWARPGVVSPHPEPLLLEMLLSLCFGAWLASRWIIMTGDPLHRIVPSIRTTAITVSTLVMVPTSAALYQLTWMTSVTIDDIAAAVSIAATVPLWVMAMHATGIRARREAK
jgi:hypothetical protein